MSNQQIQQFNPNSNVQINFFDPVQLEAIQRVAGLFCSSELVPDRYKVSEKNPKEKAIANCVIAISTAQRMGADPLLVMQNLNVIQGTPSWSAKFLTATVNSNGKYEPLKYRWKKLPDLVNIEYTEYVWDPGARKKVPQKKKLAGPITNWECSAFTTKKGSDDELESIEVSVEMAIKEGWYTKDGSKWQTMPKLMLQYRAATYWTSAYAPEISMGFKTTEEIIDMGEEITEDIPHEDVTVKVQSEINQKANATEIKFNEPVETKVESAIENARSENVDTSSPEEPLQEEKNPVDRKPRPF